MVSLRYSPFFSMNIEVSSSKGFTPGFLFWKYNPSDMLVWLTFISRNSTSSKCKDWLYPPEVPPCLRWILSEKWSFIRIQTSLFVKHWLIQFRILGPNPYMPRTFCIYLWLLVYQYYIAFCLKHHQHRTQPQRTVKFANDLFARGTRNSPSQAALATSFQRIEEMSGIKQSCHFFNPLISLKHLWLL